LFWDNTTGRLGIGTSSPSSPIELRLNNTGNGTTISEGIVLSNTTPAINGSNQAAPALVFKGRTFQANPGVDAAATFRIRQLLNSQTNGGFNSVLFELGSTAMMTISTVGNVIIPNMWTSNVYAGNESTNIRIIPGSTALRAIDFTCQSPDTSSGSSERSTVAIRGDFTGSQASIKNQLYIDPIINQAAGATGSTRGIIIRPTLTNAVDWRSIQWDNNTG
jgi:hypothetical protein